MQLPQYRIHACVTAVVRSLFGVLGFDGLDDQLGHGYPGLDAVPAQVLVQAFGQADGGGLDGLGGGLGVGGVGQGVP